MVTDRVVARFRPHGGRLFFPGAALVLLTGLWGFSSSLVTEAWLAVTVAVVYILAVIALVIYPWMLWLASRVVITAKRVVVTRGIFRRERREVLLSRVTEVVLRRSAGQLIVGAGDIELRVGDGEPAELRGIAHPILVQEVITDLAHAAERTPRSSD